MSIGDTDSQSSAGGKGKPETKAARIAVWPSWAQVVATAISAIATVAVISAAQQERDALKSSVQTAPFHSEDDVGDSSSQSSAGGKGKPETKTARMAILASWAQVGATLIAAIGLIVAGWAAFQGREALNSSAQTAALQSEDSQLSAAVTSIGSQDMTGRITGLLLLAENTADRIVRRSETGEDPEEVYKNYTSALQVFSSYVASHSRTIPVTASFGVGYGLPSHSAIPLDVSYAADQIDYLLAKSIENEVVALNVGTTPAIDLADDELFGQDLVGMNFAWIAAYMAGIDLRGAVLASSHWSAQDDLVGAHLQCADLRDADFRGADLSGADLRGAYVQGADFRGAQLAGARLVVYGMATWSAAEQKSVTSLPLPPGSSPSSTECLQDKQFWDAPEQ
jgi:hypothetical protein